MMNLSFPQSQFLFQQRIPLFCRFLVQPKNSSKFSSSANNVATTGQENDGSESKLQLPDDQVKLERFNRIHSEVGILENFVENLISFSSPSIVPNGEDKFTFCKTSKYAFTGIGIMAKDKKDDNSRVNPSDLISKFKDFERLELEKRESLRKASHKLNENVTLSMTVKICASEDKDGRIFSDFACKAVSALGLQHTLTKLPWEVKRVTILKSPFVHKKKRTQLERQNFIHELKVFNASKPNIDRLSWYLKSNVMENMFLDIAVSEFITEKEILQGLDIPEEHLMVEKPVSIN